jgi:OHCU decarboxylase
MTLQEFNAIDREARLALLLSCCGSTVWASLMDGHCPFESRPSLLATGDRIWWSLPENDWLEAFAAHPKIGERSSGRWSAAEQSGMREADATLAESMRQLNQAYWSKFGWIFIICATGKTAAEMHRQLETRLANEPAAELRLAASEQAQIIALRLEKLLVQ